MTKQDALAMVWQLVLRLEEINAEFMQISTDYLRIRVKYMSYVFFTLLLLSCLFLRFHVGPWARGSMLKYT